MAESYFDSSDPDHRAIVDDDVVDRDDFHDVAEIAEFEVISHYTRRKRTRTGMHDRLSSQDIETGGENLKIGIGPDIHDTDSTVVWLEYYKPDAANVEDSTDGDEFKKSMRHAIARMIEHIAAQREAERGVESRTRGRRSVTYSKDIRDNLPRGVTKYLSPYTPNNRNVPFVM